MKDARDSSSSSLCNSSSADYVRLCALLARTGIKLFNLAALLDFPNVIGPNESNLDRETRHFAQNNSSNELQTSLSSCKSRDESLSEPT